ncbi:MAG: hypothetical protein ACI92S_005254 [Planctomycetaceae bacterium]|jgi:hypothetical protein
MGEELEIGRDSVFVSRGKDAQSVDHRQECLDSFGSKSGNFLLGAFDG